MEASKVVEMSHGSFPSRGRLGKRYKREAKKFREMAEDLLALAHEYEELATLADRPTHPGRTTTIPEKEVVKAMKLLGRFGHRELAGELGVSESTAANWCRRLSEPKNKRKKPLCTLDRIDMTEGRRGRKIWAFIGYEDDGRVAQIRNSQRQNDLREEGHLAKFIQTPKRGDVIPGTGKQNSYSNHAEVQTMAEVAVKNGWKPTKKGGHWRLMKLGHDPITIPGTPSEYRTVENLRAEMKRKGVPL